MPLQYFNFVCFQACYSARVCTQACYSICPDRPSGQCAIFVGMLAQAASEVVRRKTSRGYKDFAW